LNGSKQLHRNGQPDREPGSQGIRQSRPRFLSLQTARRFRCRTPERPSMSSTLPNSHCEMNLRSATRFVRFPAFASRRGRPGQLHGDQNSRPSSPDTALLIDGMRFHDACEYSKRCDRILRRHDGCGHDGSSFSVAPVHLVRIQRSRWRCNVISERVAGARADRFASKGAALEWFVDVANVSGEFLTTS
jgi:hypothetical protein